VSKWGNSLAIRLPVSVVEVLGLEKGDDIEIHMVDPRVFAVEKSPDTQEILSRLRKYRSLIFRYPTPV
jgi:antitoxin MazE